MFRSVLAVGVLAGFHMGPVVRIIDPTVFHAATNILVGMIAVVLACCGLFVAALRVLAIALAAVVTNSLRVARYRPAAALRHE